MLSKNFSTSLSKAIKYAFPLQSSTQSSTFQHFLPRDDAVFGKINILMAESNKKGTYSFLDKFRGRTNKIDKNGLNQALASNRTLLQQPQAKDENAKVRHIKLASLDPRNLSLNNEQKAASIDDSSSNNPEKRYLLPNLTKRSTDVSIRSGKLDPIPLKQIKQSTHDSLVLPPSRSISDSNNPALHRRAFGKYLKLDADAMKHFQFLLQLDQRRERKSTVIYSER